MTILISALMDNYHFVLQESHGWRIPTSIKNHLPSFALPSRDQNLSVSSLSPSPQYHSYFQQHPPCCSPLQITMSSLTLLSLRVFPFFCSSSVFGSPSQRCHECGFACASTPCCHPERNRSWREASLQGSFQLSWILGNSENVCRVNLPNKTHDMHKGSPKHH